MTDYKQVKITIEVSIFVELDEGSYHAFNPAFKGLHADGATEDEAIRSFLANVPAYVDSLIKHGDPLPTSTAAPRPYAKLETTEMCGECRQHVSACHRHPWHPMNPDGQSLGSCRPSLTTPTGRGAEVMAEIVKELVGTPPPENDQTCWCGQPATIPTQWKGCPHCGGSDCGNVADIDWICADCYRKDNG